MQALNIQADFTNTALNLQSAPSKKMPDNASSFSTLVSAEIDKASKPVLDSSGENGAAEKNPRVADASENQAKSEEPKETAVSRSENDGEKISEPKNIANDVKDSAENAVAKNAEDFSEKSGKIEKNLLTSTKTEKTAKKIANSKEVSETKAPKAKKKGESEKVLVDEKNVLSSDFSAAQAGRGC